PLRYVVGSPGTYTYFGDERPLPDGTFGASAGIQCPDYNRWKFGFAGGLPPYASAATAKGIPALEHRYVARDVVYLAGGDDTDPNHRLLNKTCAAEAQGPTRLARMQFFLADMKQRDGVAFRQPMRIIPGVAHNEARVFGSPCGRAALFDEPGCAGEEEKK
ncbi:MAG: hypothetical protein WB697_03240, partial [Stellaceae bacterium]